MDPWVCVVSECMWVTFQKKSWACALGLCASMQCHSYSMWQWFCRVCIGGDIQCIKPKISLSSVTTRDNLCGAGHRDVWDTEEFLCCKKTCAVCCVGPNSKTTMRVRITLYENVAPRDCITAWKVTYTHNKNISKPGRIPVTWQDKHH